MSPGGGQRQVWCRWSGFRLSSPLFLGIKVVDCAKPLPEGFVGGQVVPVATDATGPEQCRGLVDEAKRIEREFRWKLAEEISTKTEGQVGGDI